MCSSGIRFGLHQQDKPADRSDLHVYADKAEAVTDLVTEDGVVWFEPETRPISAIPSGKQTQSKP